MKKTIVNAIAYIGLSVMMGAIGPAVSVAQEVSYEAPYSPARMVRETPDSSPKIYTIYNISMDEVAQTSSQASDAALQKAQRIALDRLFRKIVREEDHMKLPQLTDGQITELVSGFELANEKTSRVRYIADFTIHFSREKIYNFLSVLAIPFAETLSNPVHILPVVDQEGAVMLWERDNPWRAAWQAYDTINNLVPIEIMTPSKNNRMMITSWQALQGDARVIDQIAREREFRKIYIMSAEVMRDVLTGRYVLTMTIYKNGQKGPAYQTVVQAEKQDAPLDVLYNEAIGRATYWMDNQWKEKVLIHFGVASTLDVHITFDQPTDWFTIQKKLSEISLIRKVTLHRISTHGATAQLEHSGDVEQITLTLSQKNLVLAARAPVATGIDLTEPMPYSWDLTLKK